MIISRSRLHFNLQLSSDRNQTPVHFCTTEHSNQFCESTDLNYKSITLYYAKTADETVWCSRENSLVAYEEGSVKISISSSIGNHIPELDPIHDQLHFVYYVYYKYVNVP